VPLSFGGVNRTTNCSLPASLSVATSARRSSGFFVSSDANANSSRASLSLAFAERRVGAIRSYATSCCRASLARLLVGRLEKNERFFSWDVLSLTRLPEAGANRMS